MTPDWYEANAFGIATHCLACGRYELAREYHRLGTDSHARHINRELNRELKDAADIEHAVRVLGDYKAKLPEFPRLIRTHERLLEALARYPGGVDRDELRGEVEHEGATAFGVICNQLDRGGWLWQEKVGEAFVLHPAPAPPESDDVFLKAYLPTPADLEEKARTATPLASIDVRAEPTRKAGCLGMIAAASLGLLALGILAR